MRGENTYLIFYFKNVLKVGKLLDRIYELINSEINGDLI